MKRFTVTYNSFSIFNPLNDKSSIMVILLLFRYSEFSVTNGWNIFNVIIFILFLLKSLELEKKEIKNILCIGTRFPSEGGYLPSL